MARDLRQWLFVAGLVAGFVSAAILPVCAIAQPVTARVSTSAGTLTDQRGVRGNAVSVAGSVAPTISLGEDRRFGATLSGTATQFERTDWQVGGSVTVAARTSAFAGTTMTLNAGGGVSRTSFDVTFTVADATPAMEVVSGPFTVFGGARVATGRTRVRSGSETAGVPPAGGASGGASLVSVTRTSRAPVVGARWTFGDAFTDVRGTASVRQEGARVGDALIMDRTAGAGVAWRRVSLGVTFGERVAPTERLRYASGAATLTLSHALQLEAAAGRYPSHPLTGAAAGRFVTTGVVWSLGRSDVADHNGLPRPRGVQGPARGVTRLAIHAPDARWVDIYGDWNSWTPNAAQRAANGVWYVDLRLDPGEYRYAFRVNAVEWRIPDGAVAMNDGFGGKSAYVTVVRPANQQRQRVGSRTNPPEHA